MKAQRAPVAFIRSWRTMFSREVIEPPDIFSAPGFCLRGLDEIVHRLDRRIRLDHDQRRLDHEPRDRRHVRELVGRGLLHQRVGDPDIGEAGDHVRVALLADDVGGRRGRSRRPAC